MAGYRQLSCFLVLLVLSHETDWILALDCLFVTTENSWTGSTRSTGQTCTECSKGSQYLPIYTTNNTGDPTWTRVYPTFGQGVMSFNTIRNNPFSIVVKQKNSLDYIALDVHKGLAFFTLFLGGNRYTLAASDSPEAGFDKDLKVSYWLSYDKDRLLLKYGKGYVMEQTTIMTYDFLKCPQPVEDIKESVRALFDAEYLKLIEMYDLIENKHLQITYQNVINALQARGDAADKIGVLGMDWKVSFEKNPLVTNRPYVILDSKDITLSHLDRGGFTFSESLPAAAKELYENVKMTELNYPQDVSNYLLSDAIRYSINTEGCTLYKRLHEKQVEFLRMTLGSSHGDAPGIPYVFEIWPSKYMGHIHHHGNANVVIKVLFGTINVKIFNKFTPNAEGKVQERPKELFNFNASAGNFTWLDPNWYQTHKMENLSDDFCAIVQCYMYPDKHNVQLPDFDYVSHENQFKGFVPDSDFHFMEMRDIVLSEIQYGCSIPG